MRIFVEQGVKALGVTRFKEVLHAGGGNGNQRPEIHQTTASAVNSMLRIGTTLLEARE